MMNPTSATGAIVSASKKTLDMDKKFVSEKGKDALVLNEKTALEFQNKFFKDQFGIDITKINTTGTNTEIMESIINISKYYLPLPFKISIPLGFAGCILINLSLSNNRSIL